MPRLPQFFAVYKAYVSNLPYLTNKAKLETLFALCGPILDIKIIQYKYAIVSGSSEIQGAYAFITFENYQCVNMVNIFRYLSQIK